MKYQFGEKIRAVREERGRTMRDVAELFSATHRVSAYSWDRITTSRVQEYADGDARDGYVVDSRAWMASDNKHLALKKVPEGFQLPEGLRLNMNHEFYCGTCHGFHDIEAEGRIGEVPFAPEGVGNTSPTREPHAGVNGE